MACETWARWRAQSPSLNKPSAAKICIRPLAHKAAALGYSLIQNHPFVDGNKRIGHAALEVTLVLNGFEIFASTDEQERVVLAVASSAMSRDEFVSWIEEHIQRVA